MSERHSSRRVSPADSTVVPSEDRRTSRIGVAAAGGPAPAGGPVEGADLPAAAVVWIDRDGVVVDPGHPAQLAVAGVAPPRLTRAGVAAVDLAAVAGDDRPAHHHGRGGGRARRGPQLLRVAGTSRAGVGVGRRNRGRPADGGPGVAGPPDQRGGDGDDDRDRRGGQDVALGAAFGFDHASARSSVSWRWRGGCLARACGADGGAGWSPALPAGAVGRRLCGGFAVGTRWRRCRRGAR